MKLYSLLFLALFFSATQGFSQYTLAPDSSAEDPALPSMPYQLSNLSLENSFSNTVYSKEIDALNLLYQTDPLKPKWHKTDTGKSLIASGALIGVGLFTYKDSGFMNRVSIKEGINRYLPNFEDDVDDYIQYIPYASVYALDAFGVRSKHNTWRKTTTLATGVATSLIVIQGLKYGIAEPRPDGSANNSFPSGHTATAFMGAHILHKEYGERSIYYSVGGYLLATVTGIFRQLNDKHWISDVLVGAGLGIAITEFSYFVNDKFWKGEGINDITINPEKEPNYMRPSYLGVKLGYAGLTDAFVSSDAGFSAQNGFSIAADGAWFFSRNFGIGAEVGFQSFPIKVDRAVQDEIRVDGYEFAFQPMGNTKNLIGPHAQITKEKSVLGAKVLFGYAKIADTKIYLQNITNDEPTTEDDILYAQIESKSKFAWSAGLYYRFLINKRLALGAYLDYNVTDLDGTLSYIEDFDPNQEPVYAQEPLKTAFNSISAGASFNVMIW
jgi:hypothetical protein